MNTNTCFQVHLEKKIARRDKNFSVVWKVCIPQVRCFQFFMPEVLIMETYENLDMTILITPINIMAHKMYALNDINC